MMKDRLPWFKCWPGPLLNKLAEMPPDEQLAYMVILLRIYEHGGPIPDTIQRLAFRMNMSPKRLQKALAELIRAGEIIMVDGLIDSATTHQTLHDREKFSQAGKIGGSASAESRKEKTEQNQSSDLTDRTKIVNDQGTIDQPYKKKKKEEDNRLLEDRLCSNEISKYFDQLCAVYPSRQGGNPKKPALEKFSRLVKSGHDPKSIVAAAKRYADDMANAGNIGSRYVKQIQFWLSDEPWNGIVADASAPAPTRGPDGERLVTVGKAQWTESQVRERVAKWEINPRDWPEGALGGPPGSRDCKIPEEFWPDHCRGSPENSQDQVLLETLFDGRQTEAAE